MSEITLILPSKTLDKLKEEARKQDIPSEELVVYILDESLQTLDSESRAELHLKLCEKYTREAEEFLEKGDFVQASEKLWGSASQIVKAVAAKRGVKLRSRTELWNYVAKLREELQDPQVSTLWHVANSLHVNFYEAWSPPELVRDGAIKVKEFKKKLERLL